MKIAILLAAGLICLLMVHPVSTQWDARESPVIKNNLPLEPFYVDQKLTVDWEIKYPCEVTKGLPKPQIFWQWFKNGIYEGKIDTKFGERKLNGTSLSLKNINEDETYQCVAENVYGTALSNKINIRKSALTVFDLAQKNSPPSEVWKIGDSLILDCTYVKLGRPHGTFTWYTLDSGKVNVDDRVYIIEKGSLVFSYLKRSDTNTYYCENFNPNKAGKTSGGWTNVTVPNSGDMRDTVPIKLLYNTKDGSVARFGHTFKVQCIYGGKPIPRVSLISPKSFQIAYHTLDIKNITEDDEGEYTCSGDNGYETTDTTRMYIYVKGPPLWVRKLPPVIIVPEESDVDFHCEARQLRGETKELNRASWMKNGHPLDIGPGGVKERLSLSLNGNTLTFKDVRKSTDICNFQCSYSNEYGEIFADVSFNVILKTEILEAPKSQVIARGDVAFFHIQYKVDPLVKKQTEDVWRLNENKIETFDLSDVTILHNRTLVVNTSQMDEERFRMFLGNYSVVIDNGVETVVKFALLKQDPEAGGTTMHSAGLDAKWIALIVALVLFFIIFILLLCILFNRQSGDDYSVDKKERKAGHNPEKELADSGFHDLPRTDDDPGLQKPDNLSISSTGKSIASDTDSMGEYSDNDAGSRFNEDGSFIGAYQSHESKGNEAV